MHVRCFEVVSAYAAGRTLPHWGLDSVREIALAREDDHVMRRVEAVSKVPRARARQGARCMAMMFSSERFIFLHSLLHPSLFTRSQYLHHKDCNKTSIL